MIKKNMIKKNKCSLCLKVKGKRLCTLQDKSFICPRCCAEIRNADCAGCTHYAQAEQYAEEKLRKSQYKGFTAKIDPAIDDEVDKALAYVERGEFAQGETILNKLIQEHPDLYMVQYGMGTLQAMKGNYTDSISHYDKCLAIFPYFVEAWYNRGNACRELVKISEIVKSYQKVVEFGDPQEEFVQRAKAFLTDMAASVSEDTGLSLAEYVESNDTFNNAFASLQNREYEKAIIGFDKVLRFHKNNAQTYGNLGLCHAFLGQREKALAFFDQALEVDPAYAPAISNRAIVAELKEGEKMPDDQVKTVEYYKELEEIREEMKGENQQG